MKHTRSETALVWARPASISFGHLWFPALQSVGFSLQIWKGHVITKSFRSDFRSTFDSVSFFVILYFSIQLRSQSSIIFWNRRWNCPFWASSHYVGPKSDLTHSISTFCLVFDTLFRIFQLCNFSPKTAILTKFHWNLLKPRSNGHFLARIQNLKWAL